MNCGRKLSFLVPVAMLGAGEAWAATSADLIALEGATLTGSGGATVVDLSGPDSTSSGKVGFAGELSDGQFFNFFDTGINFLSGTTGLAFFPSIEDSYGAGESGQFVFSTDVGTDGTDTVYTNRGIVLQEDGFAPGVSPSKVTTFAGFMSMTDDGTAFFRGGLDNPPPTGGFFGNALYSATDTATPTVTPVTYTGQSFGSPATTVGNSIGVGYGVSRNGLNLSILIRQGTNANTERLFVSGSLVAQEGTASSLSGRNYQNIDGSTVNNAGTYAFTGDLDGSTTDDEFLVVNGNIAVREGDVVGGSALIASGSMLGVDLNDVGEIAFLYGNNTDRKLYLGQVSDVANSVVVLSIGDVLDTNNDSVSDYTVTNILGSSTTPQFSLTNEGLLYARVSLLAIGETDPNLALDAIVRVVPEPATGVLLAAGAGLMALRRRRVA